MAMETASWIWRNGEALADEYVDFLTHFPGSQSPILLRVAADSNYAAFVNGRLAAFGQYADYPQYKVYDQVDITPFVQPGENRLAIQVWYYGEDSQTYLLGKAGLIFQVESEGKLLAQSGEGTLSRISPDYHQGYRMPISMQLGFSYHYNLRAQDHWEKPGVEASGFAPSRVVPDISKQLHLRPIQKLRLEAPVEAHPVQQGSFFYTQQGQAAVNMQSAALCFGSWRQVTGKQERTLPAELSVQEGDGVYVILDMEQEQAGLLDLDFSVPCDCQVEIGYGEHLADGRCRTAVRNFAMELDAKAGENRYLNPFRRLGARYLQLFFHCRQVTLRKATLRPTPYPLRVLPYRAPNPLRQEIYDTCVRTLRLCMHEHYEDCPWREQALYCMDSRNQMLCGYYAFGETAFPRACLKLMEYGMRPDGLLSLCFPAGRDYPIPFFSLIYFIQMREYMDYSGDKTLAQEELGLLERLMGTFLNKRQPNGLIDNFQDKAHWNFYEWQPTLDGYSHQGEQSFDAPLNAFLSLALQNLSAICRGLGLEEKARAYGQEALAINRAMAAQFYQPDSGLFATYDRKFPGRYSVLANSLCLLCGAADTVDSSRILQILPFNGRETLGLEVIPNTLSMNCFRFDALLKADRAKYGPMILEEIDRDFGYMLKNGATTFWETILGQRDFDDAGSLCHGWSALPLYYYHILGDLMERQAL